MAAGSVSGNTQAAEARSAVSALAEAAANQRGTSLVRSSLRLFEDFSPGAAVTAANADVQRVSPYDLGRTHELMMAPEARRRSGAHLTPAAVALGLVNLMDAPSPTDRILDPAVGGASFLLAAADQLVADGASPDAVLDQLFGVDIDPDAVAVAEAAMALWSIDHDIAPRHLPQLVEGDGLLDPLPPVERVVGNPPFLNQLRTSSSHTPERRQALRERWRDLVGAYTDDAWVFLAAGIDALTPGGTVAMVQPVSILAARHAQAVREHVEETSHLRALWLARDKVFDASVQVCGVVAQRRAATARSRPLVRAVGANFDPCPSIEPAVSSDEWGSAAAGTLGAPQVHLASTGVACIGDMAATTAGFRDQFYGFVPHVSDASGDGEARSLGADIAPLVTVGMIDPLELRWGSQAFKFAGRTFERPAIDLRNLQEENPSLSAWTEARLRPKLLMATQTKVVEIWVDEQGVAIPATPVLSIEPHDPNPVMLWKLAAALASPVLSAYFYAAHFGTAMSLNAMKISARDIAAAPLPGDDATWSQAATLLRGGSTDLVDFGTLMCAAYGVNETDVLSWWQERMPNRSAR